VEWCTFKKMKTGKKGVGAGKGEGSVSRDLRGLVVEELMTNFSKGGDYTNHKKPVKEGNLQKTEKRRENGQARGRGLSNPHL